MAKPKAKTIKQLEKELAKAKELEAQKKAAKESAKKTEKKSSTAKEKFSVKKAITEEIIRSLEETKTIWHKDWKSMGVPVSADKNRAYKGINFLILSLKQMAKGYKSNKWITYKNMLKLGGDLLPEQKSTMVTFYTPIQINDKESGETKTIPFLKYYNVFNIEQTTLKDDDRFEDLLEDLDPKDMNRGVEDLINQFDCPIQFLKQDKACYMPAQDKIIMPSKKQFSNYHAMYSTVLHEMAHATGHKDRLDRFNDTKEVFKDSKENYAFEELVAEITSMFLLATNKIDNEAIKNNNKAYIQSWLTALKDNPDYIFKASKYAQKAFEYIDKSQAYKAKEAEEETATV